MKKLINNALKTNITQALYNEIKHWKFDGDNCKGRWDEETHFLFINTGRSFFYVDLRDLAEAELIALDCYDPISGRKEDYKYPEIDSVGFAFDCIDRGYFSDSFKS